MASTPLGDIPGARFPLPLGSAAAIASGGGNAILGNTYFVAPHNIRIQSVYKIASANEVTAATSITSASYRRYTLVNGGTAGSGTTVMASLNNTASTAANGAKSFTVPTTTVATMARGEIGFVSQLTVGAATADGTDMAVSVFQVIYEVI